MQRQLERIAKRSVPFAARELVNSLAFEGRKIWQQEMASDLVLRNQFTQRRALVERARTLDMRRMEATLGHTEPYMRMLEFGESERAAHEWRPIPTESAAGQARGSLAGGRKRAVRPRSVITKLGAIKSGGSAGRPRKARNARAVREAIKSGRKLALLDFGRRKGIYRVSGSLKRKAKLTKLYDLSRRVTPMPKVPTLERTLAKVRLIAPSIAHRVLTRQLQRAGVRT